MIWGCFVGDKLGPIAFISGSVTQDAYISLLQQYLDPFVEALGADGETNVEFQQDNARPHTAQKTRGFLEALARKHVLTLTDWLANSPNLSPIENLWVHLKHKLHERYPDTTTLKGSPETIKAVLRERLHKIWWTIEEKVLNDLVASMPRRVEEVIAARGRYTSH